MKSNRNIFKKEFTLSWKIEFKSSFWFSLCRKMKKEMKIKIKIYSAQNWSATMTLKSLLQ